jgi:TonB family protein
MDNPSFSNDENKWVEDRIAGLSPPPGWKPDPERAFERVMQEQRAASTSRGLRISLAAATLVLIAAILTLLPWNVLWTPRAAETIGAAQEPTTPAPTVPEPPKTDAVTTVAPPQTVTVQDDLKDLFVGEKDANYAKAQDAPAQLPPQDLSRLNPKKEPPIVAIGAEPPAAGIMQAAVQGQTQPTPPAAGSATEPVVVSQVQPQYTDEARAARVQGTVELLATIREDGTVYDVRVRKGLGYGLDQAALAAVEQWKFIPAKKDGKPVSALVGLLVNFALK